MQAQEVWQVTRVVGVMRVVVVSVGVMWVVVVVRRRGWRGMVVVVM